MSTDQEAVLPQYGGACISSVVPALLAPPDARRATDWLPRGAREAQQLVLLVVDGLGWLQLREHAANAPFLASMEGGPITSVLPTTTPTALCSIVYGVPPAVHGVLGFHVRVPQGVLNVLSWRTVAGDARKTVPPEDFASGEPFLGHSVPIVTRAEFAGTGFTTAMHRNASPNSAGWYMPSSLAIDIARLVRDGHPFVYAYYDGLDKIAHVHGLESHYDAELRTVDRLVADIANALPPGAALLVTADHGQVVVGDRIVPIDDEVMADVECLSGDTRMRWLHAREGRVAALVAKARRYEEDGRAWVRTVEETEREGWFGGPLSPVGRSRVGDVVLAARAPLGFADPGDAEHTLVTRHGSLTGAEMWVPLVATSP